VTSNRTYVTRDCNPGSLSKPISRRFTGKKVSPYHSTLMEDEWNKNVYHDHDDCSDRLRIKAEHKQQGTANRRHCDACVKKA
jgi:hypothetical protein